MPKAPVEPTPLEAVQAARAELNVAATMASDAHDAAMALSQDIEAFRKDTSKRLSPWRMVLVTAAGALFAGLVSLTLFVGASASCAPGDGGYCKIVAPESAGQSAVLETLIATQLYGTEYLLDGGTTESFLAGNASENADFVTILRPDGDGTWTIVSADISEEAAARTSLDFSNLPAPQESVFGSAPDDSAVLKAAADALATGLPQSVSRLSTQSGISFTSRVVPHGPHTVAVFTTIIESR